MAPADPNRPPLVLFEDEHLLVVHKPGGWNTHAPSPYAGEGIYDWLRHREPRWAALAIIHRLDKETAGVMVFGKTALANRSLSEQFSRHTVHKRYLLVTDRPVARPQFTAVSWLARSGERYLSRRSAKAGGERAETRFRVLERRPGWTLVEAVPITGRTHQVRVQAAEQGFPILGDRLYGGSPALRLFLCAQSLTLRHPASGAVMTFEVEPGFRAAEGFDLRAAILDPAQTTAARLVHGASDGWPGWYVDRLGEFLLSQAEGALRPEQRAWLATVPQVEGIYHKRLSRRRANGKLPEAVPQWHAGRRAPPRFTVRENGLCFELSFQEGASVGLFLDQRDNRRRFLVNHVAAGFPLFPGGAAGAEVLNTFAYTCGFSVCAAKAGARLTSLDLSRKHLDWGRRNFLLNGLDPAGHDFIHGDVFKWLPRLARKGRAFDAIVLDPPTFSQSKESGVFRAAEDYARLLAAALPLLKPGGVLLACTNAAAVTPEEFTRTVEAALSAAGRPVQQRHYAPQPPDFPISRAEPGHLKSLWLRVGAGPVRAAGRS